MKTSELIGPALDWAVAKCEGVNIIRNFPGFAYIPKGKRSYYKWLPSSNWKQGGPIIEREITKLFKNVGGTYSAQIRHEEDHPLVAHKVLAGWTNASGPTPLIAAMRCYVASKLGDDIDIPEELK